MKSIYCSDAGYDCETVTLAKKGQDVLNLAAIYEKELDGVDL